MSVLSPERVFIAVGSNIGTRRDAVDAAIVALDEHPQVRLVAISRIRETEPVGPVPQPRYLNAAIEIRTSLLPAELLDLLLEIERSQGRDRSAEARWGPRTLDLDILLFGERIIDQPHLTIPHPRLHERLFVLDPLSDLAPDLQPPRRNQTIRQLRDHLHSLLEPLP